LSFNIRIFLNESIGWIHIIVGARLYCWGWRFRLRQSLFSCSVDLDSIRIQPFHSCWWWYPSLRQEDTTPSTTIHKALSSLIFFELREMATPFCKNFKYNGNARIYTNKRLWHKTRVVTDGRRTNRPRTIVQPKKLSLSWQVQTSNFCLQNSHERACSATLLL